MKKEIALLAVGILLLCSSQVYAINLDVSVKPISDSFITNLNQPAVYDLIIKNSGDSDRFEIYSLVGVDIITEDQAQINSGETKKIRIKAIPQEAMRSRNGFFTFEYLFENSKNEIQKEKLSMNVISLEDAISINPKNINPKSENIFISLKNTLMYDFNDLVIGMDSAFFSYEKEIPLKALEIKELQIPANKDKLKTLTSGPYLINVKIKTSGKIAEKDIMFKFLEEENIVSTETREGIIINRVEITKNNVGNVKKVVVLSAEKNILSMLFTSVNIVPTKTEIKGFKKYYAWEKELYPDEQLKLIIKTNWLYPLLVLLLIIGLVILIKRYIETDLILRKNVSFVKTKGGEFALKVQIRVRAKKFVERIKIVDKLPSLVILYDKYGAVAPDKIDLVNKRIEWNIESLNKKEERIFSYIIYSKIGIVGKFELPPAKAVYEKEEDIKEASSNRAFFINEPEKYRM